MSGAGNWTGESDSFRAGSRGRIVAVGIMHGPGLIEGAMGLLPEVSLVLKELLEGGLAGGEDVLVADRVAVLAPVNLKGGVDRSHVVLAGELLRGRLAPVDGEDA